MDSSEQEVLAILKEGKLFGQILLVFDLPRINSIRCKTNCDVFVLNKHDFRQVLSEYPEGDLHELNYVFSFISFSALYHATSYFSCQGIRGSR